MAAIDAASSWGPQPKAHPPPPAAQAPNPTVVISRPLFPSGRFGRLMSPPDEKRILPRPFLEPPAVRRPRACLLVRPDASSTDARGVLRGKPEVPDRRLRARSPRSRPGPDPRLALRHLRHRPPRLPGPH